MVQTVNSDVTIAADAWTCVRLCVESFREAPSFDPMERCTLVGGDMFGGVTLDLVLRIVGVRMVRVTLVVEITGVDLDDPAADLSGLGIPTDMVVHLEVRGHDNSLFKNAVLTPRMSWSICRRCRR